MFFKAQGAEVVVAYYVTLIVRHLLIEVITYNDLKGLEGLRAFAEKADIDITSMLSENDTDDVDVMLGNPLTFKALIYQFSPDLCAKLSTLGIRYFNCCIFSCLVLF